MGFPRFRFKKPCRDCELLFRPTGEGHTAKYCDSCREKRYRKSRRFLK